MSLLLESFFFEARDGEKIRVGEEGLGRGCICISTLALGLCLWESAIILSLSSPLYV